MENMGKMDKFDKLVIEPNVMIDNPQFSSVGRRDNQGARDFELFWLRPRMMASKEAVLRMKINKTWDGWQLKDGLVESLGLKIGDTINTKVTVLDTTGLIDDATSTDLFASGEGADWLLLNDVGFGSIIEAKVKFVYSQAPVGGIEGKDVWKVSLVFIEGYSVERKRISKNAQKHVEEVPTIAELLKLLGK